VKNVKKDFPSSDRTITRTLALDSVSFSVAAGEFVSVVGPSACGKSTLLRLIAGLDLPNSGELWIEEEMITDANAERGLVFQDGVSPTKVRKVPQDFAKCRCIKDFRRFRNSQIGDLFSRSVLGA
jgi:ABC-type taurine transport system ATPase subunit